MASTVPRGCMDAGTRRFISIILVAVVLLSVLTGALIMLPSPDDGDGDGDGNGNGDEPQGWVVSNDVMYIQEDVEWRGLEQRLEYPIRINRDASLTIVDSDLWIALEDLIFWEQAALNLSGACQLTLVNSNLTVHAHPGLDEAVMDTDWYGWETPVIWRAVNLKEAVDPVLEFDVKFLRGYSYVVVAVQQDPQSQLRPIEVLDADEVGLDEWADIRVSLVDYIGSTPRVAIFMHNSTAYDVMLTNIDVMDRDGLLPGDVLGKGTLREDGWEQEHMDRFTSIVDYYYSPRYDEWIVNPIITGRGDVSIVDSHLQSSPGIRRDWKGYHPMSVGKEDRPDGAILYTSPERGGINLSGNLDIVDSAVSYAPITVTKGDVQLVDSSFIGDCEVVTLMACQGLVEGCDFSFVSGDGVWDDNLNYGNTWLLAMERNLSGSTIANSTFTGEGEGVGIHLNRATPGLRSNEFTDLGIGLWVHETLNDVAWDTVGSTMSYDPSCTLYYLKTTECQVLFQGPNEPWVGTTRPIWWDTSYIDGVPGLRNVPMAEYMSPHYAEYTVPVMVVGPEMGEYVVSNVTVRIRPHWVDDSQYVTLDPLVKVVTVWFEDKPRPTDFPWYLSSTFDVGNSTGELAHWFRIYGDATWFVDPYINVTMDGVLTERLDLNVSTFDLHEGWHKFNMTLDIPPGPHNVTLTFAASWHEFQEYVIVLEELSYSVYRMTGNESWSDVAAFLDGGARCVVMVDPGVVVEGIEHRMSSNATDYQRLYLLVWEGAHLGFDTFHSTIDWMLLLTAGRGTMEFGTLEMDGYHTIKNCTVRIDGLDSGWYYMEAFCATLTYTGTIKTYDSYLQLWNESSVTIDGVQLILGSDLAVYALGSNVSMRDVDISTEDRGTFHIASIHDSVVEVESCSFTGVPMAARFYDVNTTWYIMNNTYTGFRAFLTLEVNPWEYPETKDPTLYVPGVGSIEGNSFSGEGSGFLFDVFLRDEIMGVNHLSDGAVAYARYHPDVMLVGGTYAYSNITTLACYDFFKLGRLAYYSNDETYNYILDVSDDPMADDDPGLVPVVVWAKDGQYSSDPGYVIGFTEVTISSPLITVRGVDWEPIDAAIEDLLEEFNIEDNWWAG
ncbi:MAG: hypothetical protein JSW25_08815 [Thermoplasmata archaeon]|nr:MAG: hypothetical protein JSW25_08815 [Thermoplasmata archaeon]